jgi:hypothetical protein
MMCYQDDTLYPRYDMSLDDEAIGHVGEPGATLLDRQP